MGKSLEFNFCLAFIVMLFSFSCVANDKIYNHISKSGISLPVITDVYVADFQSDDMALCKPSDIDLSHAQASEFFERAKVVISRELHDHYNYAPCYIEGTLKKGSQVCEFHIRAGATGQIQCGSTVEYFACDDCQALFE